MRIICTLLFILATAPAFFAQKTELAQLIEEWRNAYHVPGLSVGIVHNGEILLADGFGVLEEGKPERATRHTLYAIASNTKAFISAAIASLVKEGKLNWDDPVQKHLPYFRLYDPCVSEMVTVRDLLCHRVGLGTFSGDVIWYRSEKTAEEVLRHAAHIPKKFEFRNGFGYNNVMYIAAGEVIRAVTGQSWDAYIREHFLLPLNMNRTVTSTTLISSMQDVATPHKPVDEQNHPQPWVAWNTSGAAGGIISSVDDMLKWMQLQLNRGILNGDTLIVPALQKEMWTPHNNFMVSDEVSKLYGGRHFNGYGLGWSTTEYHGMHLVSHTGGYDGMYSAVVLLPGEKTGIVVLTNTMRSIGTMLCFEIIDKLMGFEQGNWKERGIRQGDNQLKNHARQIKAIVDARVPGTQPTLKNSEVTGIYRCEMYGDIRIEEINGQLEIHFANAPELSARLVHWQYDTWELQWKTAQAWFDFGTVQIRKDNRGRAESLMFDVPNDDIFFEEIHAFRVR